MKRWELFFHHLDEALAGGKPFEGAVFAADMLDFEKRWSDLHDHHPCQVADASIRLRGQFTLEAWDPHTGQFSVPAYSNTVEAGQSVTVIKLSLSPVHLVFIIADGKGGAAGSAPPFAEEPQSPKRP